MAKKYLDDNGLLYFWGKLKLTFALISHTHTKSQITDFPTSMPPTSHTHGNITNAGALQSTDITIATGDKIVVTDGSNSSKVARTSLAFDTASEGTDKKALTQAGTWQTFLTAADVPEGASASTTTPKALGADNHPNGYVGAETAFARGDHVHPLSPVFKLPTATEAGEVGLVPPPLWSSGDLAQQFLRGDGSWARLSINPYTVTATQKFYIGFTATRGNNTYKFGQAEIPTATTSLNGAMSAADKTKLNGIATGAEVNVLEGVQVNGTDLTITNKKVDVPVFTGATTSAAGTVGLVPAPAINKSTCFLFGSGYWATLDPQVFYNANSVRFVFDSAATGNDVVLDYTVNAATTTKSGVMSSSDKAKLDSITMTNGVIDSSVLPSFVDDVIEAYARSNQTELGSTWLATGSASGTVITPEAGKIYVLMNSSTNYEQNTQFRWGGTAYVQLNDSGCTSITNAEIDAIVAS